MSTIQLAIEGEGAWEAAESLVALPELSGSWEASGADEREFTLAAGDEAQVKALLGEVGL